MRHNKAREASTAALNQLADAIRPCDYSGFTPDPDEPGPGADESARVLADALRGLLGALEDAQRWARETLAKVSRDAREDQFAEAIARSLRGEQ